MTAAEMLARVMSGSVQVTAWSDDTKSEETVEIDWQVVNEGAYDLELWLNQRADLVDAERATGRRDRTLTYAGGPAGSPLPAALDDRHVLAAIRHLGLTPHGLHRVVLERRQVTVTEADPVDGGSERVTVIPVIWP